MSGTQSKLLGWGRFPVWKGRALAPRSPQELALQVVEVGAFLPRGQGRSYGDASLADTVILSGQLNCIKAFDVDQGLVSVEAGITFRDLLAVIVPRGWFVAVTPGTSAASIGGAIAADVHGKNHHCEGSFKSCVLSLELLLPSGELLVASATQNADLFEATLGGMGLTGFILSATLKLRPITSGLIQEEVRPYADPGALLEAMESADATYSVAWLDLLSSGRGFGRGLLSLGEHMPASAEQSDRSTLSADFAVPSLRGHPTLGPVSPLRDLLMRAFNHLYYARGSSGKRQAVPLAQFFYPLDALGAWNKLYGSAGFLQYQFVIPHAERREGLAAVYQLIKAFTQKPYLCVLKSFGPGEGGLMAFPMHGPTLAMDFPRRGDIAKDLEKLDALLIELGGRVYLAKDAVSSDILLRSGYPNLNRFLELRDRIGTRGRVQSLLSSRLGID